MKALITYENGEILSINRYPKIPNDWRRPNGNWVLGYVNRTEWHYDDGWRDFEEPTFDPFNFKKTQNLIEVDGTPNYVTYEVVEMTQAEKDAYADNHKNKTLERLNTLMAHSRLWLRAILMGKKIADDLDYFEDVYRTKYNQCLDPNGTFDNLLTMESQLEGFATLQEYKDHVITRWEQGLGFYEGAKALLEVFRKRVLLDLNLNDLEKATLRMDELDALPETLQPTEFQGEFERIMNL